jgi:hypothetical protein
VPSPVSAIRTPNLPLLPLWEKGAGGMRGKGARECRTSLISPKNSTLESRGDEGHKAQECSTPRIAPRNAPLESGMLLIFRADPSYPCQSVFSSGAPSCPVRAEALPEHGEAPAGLARGRSCGLKPSLSAGKPLRGWRDVARCGLKPSLSAGKPLRAISRFSHQDAQPPPSPLVGEGGRGDEGQRRAGMQNIAHLSQKLYT